jgi:hypothetical protein
VVGTARCADRKLTSLKTRAFDRQAVISTAQLPDNIVKYLRNAEKKTGLSGRKRRVLNGVQLILAGLCERPRSVVRRGRVSVQEIVNYRETKNAAKIHRRRYDDDDPGYPPNRRN